MFNKNTTIPEKFILKGNNVTVTTLFNNNKVYLTLKEISKLFGTKKRIIKDILKNIIIKSEFNNNINNLKIYNKTKEKNEIFYNLDLVISIGYRLKSYDKTKFLVNSNLILKKYNSKRIHNLRQKNYTSNIIGKFFNYFNESIQLR